MDEGVVFPVSVLLVMKPEREREREKKIVQSYTFKQAVPPHRKTLFDQFHSSSSCSPIFSVVLLACFPFLSMSGLERFDKTWIQSCEDLWRECAPGGLCPPSSIPDLQTVFSFVCARDHFVTTLMGCCFVNLNKDSLLSPRLD
ncbi:hypothetical protein MUK42_28872 [Musa troglodytarum]|uniref:Uncharacterized protein n=1 Tax=Musa troglodytarum TaxID=320322 RepID=A0A9E7FLC4_9LILI|nr:hypothetical protein MUK42_28872 [Musa troglodytarum]